MFLVRLLKLAMSEDCGIIEVYVLKYHPNDSFIKFVRKDLISTLPSDIFIRLAIKNCPQ